MNVHPLSFKKNHHTINDRYECEPIMFRKAFIFLYLHCNNHFFFFQFSLQQSFFIIFPFFFHYNKFVYYWPCRVFEQKIYFSAINLNKTGFFSSLRSDFIFTAVAFLKFYFIKNLKPVVKNMYSTITK